MKRKPHYDKKETWGRRIVKQCWDTKDFRRLDVMIGEIHDSYKKREEKCQDTMKKLDELFLEFTSNPKLFVEKYAKMDDNEYVLKIIEKNPNWAKGLEWY
jgi:hypothetical protein